MSRARRHPGTVRSDVQAFRQISQRFQAEVGGILGRIDFTHGPVPFWSLLRVMFPVAESLGDLIYRRDDATALNLRSVLETDFEAVRPGYRGKAALLALLYRHSLTHHDELRVLESSGKRLGWKVSGAEDSNHLRTVHTRGRDVVVEFQPRSFYVDIVGVCARAQKMQWGGHVRARYNAWMRLDLDATRVNSTVKIARMELAAI